MNERRLADLGIFTAVVIRRAVVLVCFFVASTAVAPSAGAEEERPAFKLELKPAPKLPSGKVVTIQGTGTPEGDRFFVEAVGVLQPVVVTLIAQKKGDALKLVLAKQRWDESLRTADVGPEGQVTLKLRTQGELRIIVTAQGEPKPYWLVVWVGDEVKPELAPVLTPMKGHKAAAGGKGGSSTGSIVIAAVIGVLLIILVVWLKRKRGPQ